MLKLWILGADRVLTLLGETKMKKSLTFLLGTLMVAGVLAGATTSTPNVKNGKTINPVLHGGGFPAPAPSCNGCTSGGNSGGR